MKNMVLILSALVLCAGAVGAQTWKPDPPHSRVRFSVTHMLIAEVDGRFTQFDVTLNQGKEDFAGSTVEVIIKTASITTENENRDKHLRSDDFFNAEKYPEITFKSTSFEKTGDKTYKITGDLTIRDVTKNITLDAKYLGSVTDARGNTRVAFRATTTINRFDFGVKWDRKLDVGGLVVSENVDIMLNLELMKQK
jgi:polyisoprenoid-binding protein YceI